MVRPTGIIHGSRRVYRECYNDLIWSEWRFNGSCGEFIDTVWVYNIFPTDIWIFSDFDSGRILLHRDWQSVGAERESFYKQDLERDLWARGLRGSSVERHGEWIVCVFVWTWRVCNSGLGWDVDRLVKIWDCESSDYYFAYVCIDFVGSRKINY